jgi:CheY-like chemotaxis protein
MERLHETNTALTVCLSVVDTGCGVPPDKQALIFESFTQAYANTARHHGGTGLGLSISQALIEQMGGTLTLTSVVEQGSTFAFTLVLQKAAREIRPVVATPLAPLSPGRLAGARVLLVEDNHINRTVAQMLLEPWGVLLTEAVDGPEALELLTEESPFDVVLLDIQLPTLGGLDVIQRLRQLPDPRRAATPVIALTANAFQIHVERYLAAGFNDYLAKPYDEVELYQKIERLLPA